MTPEGKRQLPEAARCDGCGATMMLTESGGRPDFQNGYVLFECPDCPERQRFVERPTGSLRRSPVKFLR